MHKKIIKHKAPIDYDIDTRVPNQKKICYVPLNNSILYIDALDEIIHLFNLFTKYLRNFGTVFDVFSLLIHIMNVSLV